MSLAYYSLRTMSDKRPSHILLLPTVAGVGGCTRVVAMLADEWRAMGVDARIVFPDPGGEDTAAALEWLNSERTEAQSSDAVPAWYEEHGIRAMWRMYRWLRSHRRAAVYLHYGSNQIAFRDVLVARLARVALVAVMVHHAAPITGRRRQFMTRLGGMLAHRVVVSTPAMEHLLRSVGIPGRKLDVVSLAVPRPKVFPDKMEARRRLGIPASAWVVSVVARLDRGKNVPTVVEAVSQLAREGRDIHLVVAGVGEDLMTVSEMSDRLLETRGHILGRVPEVESIYSASDVFVLPSSEEGFGLVFLEAAWHAVPSVALNVGGVRFAIEHGESGILLASADGQSLATLLGGLLDDATLLERLGSNARLRVESKFSVRRMAEAHLSCLGFLLTD